MMKRLSLVLLFMVLAVFVFAAGSTEVVESEAPEEPWGGETEIVVYTTMYTEFIDAMKEGFEASHPGVTVNVVNPGGTEAMFKKLETESGNPQADVVQAGSKVHYEHGMTLNLLEPYAPQAAGFEPVMSIGSNQLELSQAEDYYHVFTLMFTGIMYNQQVLDRYNLPVPKTYKDLGNPIYKDQIISANPLKSSTANSNTMAMLQIYGDEAPALWDAINENLLYYSSSSSRIYTLCKKGEFALALALSRPALSAKKEGYPVDFVFPEDGSQIYDNAMALVRGAKHPNLAREFIDYIFSDDMQLRGSEFLYIPIKTGLVDPSLPNSLENLLADIGTIYSPDIVLADENRTLIQDTFGEYIRTKGLK